MALETRGAYQRGDVYTGPLFGQLQDRAVGSTSKGGKVVYLSVGLAASAGDAVAAARPAAFEQGEYGCGGAVSPPR